MKWDLIGLGEVRRKAESVTTLQSDHLLHHYVATDGLEDLDFVINKKWKVTITRFSSVAELVLRIKDIPAEDHLSVCTNHI